MSYGPFHSQELEALLGRYWGVFCGLTPEEVLLRPNWRDLLAQFGAACVAAGYYGRCIEQEARLAFSRQCDTERAVKPPKGDDNAV